MIQPATAALLTDGEVEYLCELITPKEIKLFFQKHPADYEGLKPASRAKTLDDQKAINLVTKNRHKLFISTFLDLFIGDILNEIQNAVEAFENTGADLDTALIQVLADSKIFSEHVDLYFKLKNDSIPDGYISLVKAAVTLLHKKATESNVKQSSDAELAHSLECAQHSLIKEREEHKQVQALLVNAKLEAQRELEYIQGELSQTAAKMEQMQTELDRFHRLEGYADIPQENAAYEEYQYISLCQVILINRTGQIWLKRLADIQDDQLVEFHADKTLPPAYGNRDRIYRQNGPSSVGAFGIWHWRAGPSRDDPEKDQTDSRHDVNLAPIEILILSNCAKPEDVVELLAKGIPADTLGEKTLISIPPVDDQYSGFLCDIDDFNIQSGIAKLKISVFTLPLFQVHTWSTLTLNGRIFCRKLALGLPLELVRVKDPLTLVKNIILDKTTVGILQQQGLGKNEARRCLSYLKSLETLTLYDEVAENYGCSVEDAQKYVTEFVEQAEKSLSGLDINTNVLSAIIMRNSTLMSKCKAMLYEDWSVENEEQLRLARQTLENTEKRVEQQRHVLATLEKQQNNLRQQAELLQTEIAENEALAATVEQKVSKRIAEAQKNAANFISDLFFTMPIATPKIGSDKTALPVFTRPADANEIAGTIVNLSDFEDNLAENLECCGYSEERSAVLAQILSFCIGQHMPIICDSNSEVIADCLAAMFGLNGATVIHLSTGESSYSEVYNLLRQKENVPSQQVYLINGALDSYSPNIFNGILQNTYNLDGCILIFSSEGTPSEALPHCIWGRAMFVDGDIGLIHLQQDNLKAFETKINFRQKFASDKLKEKRKQLKPFAQIISNRALLSYACYMATANSSIQSDTCILTQLLLSAKSSDNLEDLLEQFKANGIDVENGELSKYL